MENFTFCAMSANKEKSPYLSMLLIVIRIYITCPEILHKSYIKAMEY